MLTVDFVATGLELRLMWMVVQAHASTTWLIILPRTKMRTGGSRTWLFTREVKVASQILDTKLREGDRSSSIFKSDMMTSERIEPLSTDGDDLKPPEAGPIYPHTYMKNHICGDCTCPHCDHEFVGIVRVSAAQCRGSWDPPPRCI